MKPTCPNCQSHDVTYRTKKQCYICEDCNTEFVPEQEFKALRIFISYGHDEYAPFAQKLKYDLIARGHEVWFDIDRLKPGGDWEQYIEEGLDWVAEIPGTGRMILLMTPHSVRRPDGFCLNEISRALDHHLFIVPVMLVWCKPPLTISRIQWLDMQHCSKLPFPEGRYDTSKQRLIEALEHQKLDFEGQASLLYANLQPLSFEADIIHYQKWFTGRKWVFDKIDHWLQEKSGPRLFWITGLPGIGKTAIATQLRERLPNMVAFHLCRRGNSEKASPRRTVMSIAHQLSTQLSDYAERLATINLTQLLSSKDINASAMFDRLIVQPLAMDIKRPLSPQVILIDGLDEATQDGRNILAEFIASEFHKLPDWLRLIITSRPDAEVTQPLQSWDRWKLEAESTENRKDMEEYIRKMLDPLNKIKLLEGVINTTIQYSEGIFLYAEWVCREILDGKLSPEKPEEFPKGLGEVYATFFRNKLTTEQNYKTDIKDYNENIRPVIELVLAARDPLPLEQISKWMQWTIYDQKLFLKKFGSLFFLDVNSCLRPFHSSVLDWLGDHHMAGDFYVDKKMGNKRLAELLWHEYKQDGALKISRYGLKHLPGHLLMESMWDKLTDLLCNLDFIQSKAAAKMTYELVEDFQATLQVIPENQEKIRKEQQWQARMDKYTSDLITCAKGKLSLDELEIPESADPLTDDLIDAEIGRKKNNPTRADRLSAFLIFLYHEAGTLQNHAHEFPFLSFQQAWNYCSDGPIGEAANNTEKEKLKNCILLANVTRPFWNPLPLVNKWLAEHEYWVTSLAVTADGKRAISASLDKCIVWDVETGRILKILLGHTETVISISITPDGKKAVSASDDTCILWDLETGTPLKTLKEHIRKFQSVAINPLGNRVVTVSDDRSCIVWSLRTGKPLKMLYKHTKPFNSVAITPDGKKAVSASEDGFLFVWDLEKGEVLKKLTDHSGNLLSLDITPNGKWAVSSASWEHTFTVWNLETGKVIKRLSGHTANINSVALTPDGKMAVSASGDNTCIVWNLLTGKVLKTLFGHTDKVNSVAITPDGKRVISASDDKTCIVWELENGKELKIASSHAKNVKFLVFDSILKYVLPPSWIRDLKIEKNLETLKYNERFKVFLTISPDGKKCISASHDHTCIVWSLETGDAIGTFASHNKPVNSAAISLDGKRLVSASQDHTCIVWELETGDVIKTLHGHSAKVNFVTITPDGKRAISASDDKTCIIWDMETGKALKRLIGHTGRVASVVLTLNGEKAVSTSWDCSCIVWDLKTGIALKTLIGHSYFINSVAVTPDGEKVVSASGDNSCILWNLKSGEALGLSGHSDIVNFAAITPDGKRAISVSKDKTCIIWDLETGRKIARFFSKHVLASVTLEDNWIYIKGLHGEVFFLEYNEKLE